jgi:hypothetical protein
MERNDIAAALKNVKLEGFVWPDPDDAGDLRVIKDSQLATINLIP